MQADEKPTAPPPSGYQRMRPSLARCRVCGRTDELAPADVMARLAEGAAVCCGQLMDLFVPASWPGASGVVGVPQRRVTTG
jgi:hypothetical protein